MKLSGLGGALPEGAQASRVERLLGGVPTCERGTCRWPSLGHIYLQLYEGSQVRLTPLNLTPRLGEARTNIAVTVL